MKKVYRHICLIAIIICLLAGCAQGGAQSDLQESSTDTAGRVSEVNIAALKGPTGMGLVEFMDKAENGDINGVTYNFTVAASADEVVPKLAQGELDIAALPANLAAVLYNNTEKQVQVLGINTLGVLYIVEKGEEIASVADLKGKTIYASGKGAVPEYALRYVLENNGIDMDSELTVEWKSAHAECLAALMADEEGAALLPQPFVTTAQKKSENIKVALDLTEEWDKLQKNSEEPSALITGVVVVRKEFAEENPSVLSEFMDMYSRSAEYVNDNAKEAAELIDKYGIVAADIAEDAIPYCSITFIEGEDMKSKLSGYLKVLFDRNPKSVGGALPDDDFYYQR